MDFYQFVTKENRKGVPDIYPDWVVGRSQDLMVRGRSFYAIWDEEAGLWSTDEYDVQRLVDADLRAFAEKARRDTGVDCKPRYLRSFGSSGWSQFRKFLQNISDNSKPLDTSLTFANTDVKKTDYVSKRLPYALAPGDHSAWDEILHTLYPPDEAAKIEWAIGAVVSGDSKTIQKFLVLYGPPGTGKGTIISIIQKLFDGYTTTFEAKALGSSGAAFSTEVFKDNPLVAIQHDGDLSKIEDNARLNSIISHEDMTMNEKFKPSYTSRVNAFLFMGTNTPVKISDAKSGIIRRLLDANPSGTVIPPNHYATLMARIPFELGAIAHHCLEVYRKMGKNYYAAYRPVEMMFQTDVFFNFIEAYYDTFKELDSVTLKQAYAMYKEYCADTGIDRVLPQYKIREELRNYFEHFKDRATVDGVMVRSYYSGFNAERFKAPDQNDRSFSLVLEETVSLLDDILSDQPAQLATDDGIPKTRWANVESTLAEIDTTQLHYVKVPEQHIVIDFDLKDESGEKSLEMNLTAASAWPPTYAELSKGGAGVHLHYLYEGDVNELATDFSKGIEVKVYKGNSALRRRLTRCNNVPVASINSGLPLKEKAVISEQTIRSEQGLRALIEKNLRKEVHPGTKPSIDFIAKILDDANKAGMTYDVLDLRPRIIAFANNSTNHAHECLAKVLVMKFQGREESGARVETGEADKVRPSASALSDKVFFDVEVYPNLFVVCWKYAGKDTVVKMINPTAAEIEQLFKFQLIGFNNRRYDNHILYGRYMGFNNAQLYELSKKIIDGNNSAMFGEAYNLSYTDIYDFSSKKQGLKKFQIELGILHMEMDIPWDQPVPDDMIEKVVEYCANDVISTEKVFEYRKADYNARLILSELSGLTPNDTTQKHTARIIFGTDRRPQEQFEYTKLETMFPGYEYSMGTSTYKGEVTGEGGYVYAEPGMYENVALLDVASMHPTSIEQLNLFGKYTENFSALKAARLAIKHKDFDTAKVMLGGKLAPFLGKPEAADELSYALKIVINIVYGLTSAKFDNPFRDLRNKDNIVAKRGALFMIDLKEAVQAQGFTVAHIKTDSIKIPNATPEIIDFVYEFGQKYGYEFEHEATYEKFCLVNDAVYIAKSKKGWTATGAQFQHPFVFKSLFTLEPVTFEDLREAKSVTQGAMYLKRGEELTHVGRTGQFVPVTDQSGGAELVRIKDGKQYAVAGTKGYLWMDATLAQDKVVESEIEIDMSYYDDLAQRAIETINKFGDFYDFSISL